MIHLLCKSGRHRRADGFFPLEKPEFCFTESGFDGKIFFMSTRPLVIGDFVKVKINDCIEYDLLGELYE